MGVGKSGDYRLGYRGDIEGLRAVAILLVVACHAKVSWLAGGFVGVDVFYVLSGYLITGLLVQEIHTTGTLRFARFYGRRLRRLLPALLLMVFVVCVLGKFLLAAGGQAEQALAASSATLWLSNFHFAFANIDYFAPSAETNLFLHTWSLGVEEQFYLVWPLLVLIAMGAKKGAKQIAAVATLKYAFGCVFILALILSVYWTWHAPRLAFYMMPSRAWQFALGALVFLTVGTPKYQAGAQRLDGRCSIFTGWIGLMMILVSALLIDGAAPYPGYWALLPTLGTALTLAAGAGKNRVAGVNRWLSTPPMQAIGRVSYSWYLWHWPVLLLGAQIIDTHNGWNRLLLVIVSLMIAAGSYRFLEVPIRHNRKLLARPRIAVFGSFAIMAFASSFAVSWHTSALKDMNSPEQRRFAAAHSDLPVIYRMGCDDFFHSARVHICTFGDPHAKHTVVAIGDSITAQWFPAYMQIYDKPNWRLLAIIKGGCPMVNVPVFYPPIKRTYTECAEWRQNALREIATIRPDVVITSSLYTYAYTRTQWIDGTRSVLADLARSATNIYMIRPTPTLPFNGPHCLASRNRLNMWVRNKTRCSAPAQIPHNDAVFDWLKIAADPFRNVHLIDMTNKICPNGVCHAQLGKQIVFRDDTHLTASFAGSLAPELAQALGVPFPNSEHDRSVATTRIPWIVAP